MAPNDRAQGLRVHLRLEQARELAPLVSELAEVTFIGHSHLCRAFAIGDGEVSDVVAQRFGIPAATSTSSRSARWSSPATDDNRSCFALYDTDSRTVEYHRVEYDIEASAQKIFDAEAGLELGKRLFLGV